jgi:hypothetical protein
MGCYNPYKSSDLEENINGKKIDSTEKDDLNWCDVQPPGIID